MLEEFKAVEQEPIGGKVAAFKGSYQSYISEKCHYKNIEGFFTRPQTNQDLGKVVSSGFCSVKKNCLDLILIQLQQC